MNIELIRFDYDYAYLPADGAAGGAYVAWRRDRWHTDHMDVRHYLITLHLNPSDGHGDPWWLTNVYGPTDHAAKDAFLLELCAVRSTFQGLWAICDDFNMIYQVADKSNGCLHPGLMRRFRSLLDDLRLDELHLVGRLYTWSSHCCTTGL